MTDPLDVIDLRVTALDATGLPSPGDANGVRVSEVFGPTIQGEGPSAGRRAVFIRLAGCNLNCAWCDTPYTWDWKGQNGVAFDPAVEVSRRSIMDVAAEAAALAGGLPAVTVITGGEPLVQAAAVAAIAMLTPGPVEVETNGTRPPLEVPGIRYNVSPKLDSSGCDPGRRYVPYVLDQFVHSTSAAFKFVCADDAALAEVDALVAAHRIPPDRVWVMPEGVTADAVLSGAKGLAGPVIERGYNLSVRVHTLLWGDERRR